MATEFDLRTVKCVIWDLDETFWKGTLSEEEVVPIEENINFVKSLNVKPKPETEGKKGFVCKVCSWIYEGETLPDDIVCPLCKHRAADFEPIG